MIDVREIIEKAVKTYVKENIDEDVIEKVIENAMEFWIDNDDIETAIEIYVECNESEFKNLANTIVQEDVNEYLERNISF